MDRARRTLLRWALCATLGGATGAACSRFVPTMTPAEAGEGYACPHGTGCRTGMQCLDGHCRWPCSGGCPGGYACTGTTRDGTTDYCLPVKAPPPPEDIER